jgi:hypothetical protein
MVFLLTMPEIMNCICHAMALGILNCAVLFSSLNVLAKWPWLWLGAPLKFVKVAGGN